jgi:hypothetical protein
MARTDGGLLRTRWAALGAAVAVAIGGASLGVVRASISEGERAVYVPINPCRLADTRSGSVNVGDRSTPLRARETHTFRVHGRNGNCNIPADATAIVANVTAVSPTATTFITMWPAERGRPAASSLNVAARQSATPNSLTVALSSGGSMRAYNEAGSVHLVIDVAGYFADHDHDDRYLQIEPIGVALGSRFDPSADAEPVDFANFADGTYVFAGNAFKELHGPAFIGDVDYVIGAFAFCVDPEGPTATVDEIAVVPGDLSGEAFFSETPAEEGCNFYFLETAPSLDTTYALEVRVSGTAGAFLFDAAVLWVPLAYFETATAGVSTAATALSGLLGDDFVQSAPLRADPTRQGTEGPRRQR